MNTMTSLPLNNKFSKSVIGENMELSSLISLAGAINNVLKKNQLFEFFKSILKPQLEYTHYILFTADVNLQSAKVYLSDVIEADGSLGSPFSVNKRIDLSDPYISDLILSGTISILNWGHLKMMPGTEKIFSSLKGNDIEEIALIPFNYGVNSSGLLVLGAAEERKFQQGRSGALELTSTLVSGALTRILLSDEIKQSDFEKEILLSVMNDIAASKNKKTLLSTISLKLKQIIPFNGILITCAEQNRNFHYTYLYHFEEKQRNMVGFEKFINTKYAVKDGVNDVLIEQEGPAVFSIAKLLKTESPQPYLDFYKESGIKEIAGVALRNGNTEIGSLLFISEIESNFTARHLDLIKGISSDICMAVANSLAYDMITRRENEKATLLGLSNDIATIQDQSQLLKILRNKIKKLIPFNDIGITLYNHDKKTHHAFLFYSEEARVSHPDYEEARDSHSPMGDGVVNLTMQSDSPVIFRIDDLIKNDHVPVYVKFYKKTGIKEFVGVSMYNRDGIFGGLYIFSEHLNTYHPKDFSLIRGIADQLSFTVSNILSTEEIVKRENEKSILLMISNDMATARNKGDLLKMLHERLNKVFYFSHTSVALIDNSKATYSGYIYDPFSRSISHPDFNRLSKVNYPLTDAMMSVVLASDFPVIFDLDTVLQNDDAPAYAHMHYDTGIREIVVAKLTAGNQPFGFLMIFSDVKKSLQMQQLKLVQGISYQLSNAVANIIANDKIIERENEKSILLMLSNDMFAVRNKADLHHVVNERLKTIIPCSHILTGRITEDEKMTAFLLDPESKSKEHPDYKEVTAAKYSINDGIVDVVFETGRPIVFDLEELLKKSTVPEYIKMNYNCGIKEVVIAGLSSGKRKTGILAMFCSIPGQITNNHLNLIQGISSQLSTVMANILANEKIERQIEEISGFKRQLEVENLYLQEEIQTTHNYSEIIGSSQGMRKVFQMVSQVAEASSSVLLLGETGTGKELIARAIHNSSGRKDKLMVKVNCAALPANLIESELFGHEKGSFTGATERRIGKFELANNSTLFLDEIGEMPPDLQVKLLRALQEKEIERIGGRTVIKTDVRVIAATNRNLQKEVQLGNFRSDLYFRLNVFPIMIPSLRERKEDIPILATHFLNKHAKKGGKKVVGFSSNVLKEMGAYDWPGNVRELEHLIERSILLTTQPVISQLHLPSAEKEDLDAMFSSGQIKTIDEIEREHIMFVLKTTNGKVAGIGGAASILKIPSTTLNSKIKRLGIKKEYMTE